MVKDVHACYLPRYQKDRQDSLKSGSQDQASASGQDVMYQAVNVRISGATHTKSSSHIETNKQTSIISISSALSQPPMHIPNIVDANRCITASKKKEVDSSQCSLASRKKPSARIIHLTGQAIRNGSKRHPRRASGKSGSIHENLLYVQP